MKRKLRKARKQRQAYRRDFAWILQYDEDLDRQPPIKARKF